MDNTAAESHQGITSSEEINNRAPNDGLGLNEVHGWGFGTANKGQARYYLDDFELLGKP